MKKKITALCSVFVALSVMLAVFSVNAKTGKTDVTTATAKVFYAENEESTTSSSLNGIVNDILGGIGSDSSSDKLDSVIGSIEGVSGDIDSAIGGFGDTMDSLGGLGDSFGGLGDAFGGIGDSLGGIGSGLDFGSIGDAFGGLFGGSSSGSTTTTTSSNSGLIIPVPAATQNQTEAQTNASTDVTAEVGETVDFAATSNPYTKPTSTFVAGDQDETIKWLQWIFVYTGYGLKDNGITGVLDEDTVAVVKKLQHENNLTVDGNITEDVISAAEVLYYQNILGSDVSAIEVSSDATTGAASVNQNNEPEKDSGASTVVLIIILVIIWVLAIGGIVLLFVFKKKKDNAIKKAEAEKADAEKLAATEGKEEKKSEISSLSDLFEEAENNSK